MLYIIVLSRRIFDEQRTPFLDMPLLEASDHYNSRSSREETARSLRNACPERQNLSKAIRAGDRCGTNWPLVSEASQKYASPIVKILY